MFSDPNQDVLELLQAAVEQAFNAVLVTDANLHHGGPLIQFCNPAFCRMTGYQARELIGRSPRLLQGPDTDPAVIDRLRECLHAGEYFQGSTINYRKDGTPYHVEWNISPIRDRQGLLSHFVSVQQNITQRIEAERMRDLLAEALNVSTDPVLITDDQARICFVNRSFETVNGHRAADVLGQTPKFLQSGAHDRDFYNVLVQCVTQGQPFRATFRNQRKDGSHYFADQSITPILDSSGRITHYLSISKDISEAVVYTQQLSEKVTRDELTDLLNRRGGEQVLAESIQRVGSSQSPLSVLLGDIDHFKQVNDTHGHLVGDQALQSVARVVRGMTRQGDHAVRWGGEEFLLILPDTALQGALGLAARIQAGLAAVSHPQAGAITMSWGATTWLSGESAQDLLARADELLYLAKDQGRNRVASELPAA